MATTELLISLDNFEKYEATHILNSPRSLEACRREGVEPEILCYRPLNAFAAPGKPQTLQEAEFAQYEKKRQNMIRALKAVRDHLISEEEKRTYRRHHIRTGSAKVLKFDMSSKKVGFPPQAQYYSHLLQKQVVDARRAQDRDNNVVFKYIEDTAKLLEQQTAWEKQKMKEEWNKIQRAVEVHKTEKIKAEKHKKNLSEVKQMKQRIEEERRRKTFEKMVEDIQEQLRRKELSTLEAQQRLKQLKEHEAELKMRKLEYDAMLEENYKQKDKRYTEKDKKIQEKKIFTELLKKEISRETKAKRIAMELRHYFALAKSNSLKDEKLQEAVGRLQRIEEKLKSMEKEKRNSSREVNDLMEAKVVQIREQEQQTFTKRASELQEKLTKEQEKIAAQRQKRQEENELKKKHKAITHKMRLENLERQQKKDAYKKHLEIKYRKQQAEKLENVFKIRSTLKTQGNYIKLANELRKTYLRKEMECSKGKCLTIDKLIDINEKFGSATESRVTIDTNPQTIKRQMVRMLSDPFSRDKRSEASRTIQSSFE